MISHQNYEVYATIFFYIVSKIVCFTVQQYRASMYKGRSPLTSIPEKNETEDEISAAKKWVPKKKHEVLKAKYKCLKKLFQIYDASVIGILPDPYSGNGDGSFQEQEEIIKTSKRKKRSYRTKTDTCAESLQSSHSEKNSATTSIITDFKLNQCSNTSSHFLNTKSNFTCNDQYAATENSEENLSNTGSSNRKCECALRPEPVQHPIPYLVLNEKRKLTRFQCFIQRIFGINRERTYKNYILPGDRAYAVSENNITHNCDEKRRRRGLRFRRVRRPKKIHSDGAIRDMKCPEILTYVQSVQKNCLQDTTARQCPIMGCKMMFYGIINYNDHLNLCHFTDRKFVCHYCHEGFVKEYDKYVHENEHIGITKLTATVLPSSCCTKQNVSKTQTDPEPSKCNVPEEKLKKIVSFFDKLVETDQIASAINKNRYSESNLHQTETATADNNESETSDRKTSSCIDFCRKKCEKKCESSVGSDVTSKYLHESPVECHFCGEHFEYRRQLSLHVDLEHRTHNKFSKFHSCVGILNTRQKKRTDMVTEDGKIKVHSPESDLTGIRRVNTSSTISQNMSEYSEVSRRKSEENVTCDPSTNIVYYTSVESISKKPSKVNSSTVKLGSKIHNYKWEPETRIIRV